MVAQHESAESAADIHLWMSAEEAAEALGLSGTALASKAQSGELQSRVAADGTPQVLVGMPPRTRENSVTPRRRGSFTARAAVVMIIVAMASAATATIRTLRQESNQLQDVTARLVQASSERDQLRGELAQAHQAIAHAEGELAVERKVEDSLIQGALARAAADHSHPTVVANSAQ